MGDQPRSMARLYLSAATLFLLLSASLTAADDSQLQRFAQLKQMTGAHLSPDGTQVAFLSAVSGRYHVVIERFSPSFSRHMLLPGDELDFEWVRWTSNDRLVVASSWSSKRDVDIFTTRRQGVRTEETRLFSVSSLGQDLTYIIKPETYKTTGSRVALEMPAPQLQDDVIDWLPDDPNHILVALDADMNGWFEVRRIDVRNGDYETAVGDFGGPVWITDQTHTPRIGWGFSGRDGDAKVDYLNQNGDWEDVSHTDWAKSESLPLAFTEDPTIAYAMAANDAGRRVIRKLDLETNELLDIVFEHESVDVDGIVYDDASDLPVGVSYTDHVPRVHYFDDEMRKLHRSIDGALPDSRNRIVSTTSNRRQILILAYSDSGLGSYFLWDRDAKSLAFYESEMADLDEQSLSPVRPVQSQARDGLNIAGYLTTPRGAEGQKLPTVVLPHGGPNARADQRFNYLSQFLAARGYQVFEPNFRGSTGYGTAFMQAGYKEWGGKMQDDVTDGTQWLIDEGLADPERICIAGWSYGGYSAAMGVIKEPDLYQCAASINGIMHLPRQLQKNREYSGGRLWNEEIGLEDEFASTVSPVHQAEKIKVPLLIVQVQDDARVARVQGRLMKDKLESLDKKHTYVEIEFGGHSLINEPGRQQVLKALDEFLGENIGTK